MPDDVHQNPDPSTPPSSYPPDDSSFGDTQLSPPPANQPDPTTASTQPSTANAPNPLEDTQQIAKDGTDSVDDISNKKDTNPENIITSPHVPKKYGGKKIIATIFGVLLLIGGVTAGVFLVQRQQEIAERAASGSACSHAPDCELLDNPGNSGSRTFDKTITRIVISAGTEYFNFESPGSNDGCYDVVIDGTSIQWNKIGSGTGCKDISNIQVWFGSTQITPTEPQATPTEPQATPTEPQATPTEPPPSITAECSEVKAYNTSWVLLTQEQLNNLNSGDKVRFTVSGSTSEGTFDKARFTINGSQKDTVSTKKPGSEEFYYEYTIPSGVTSFTVDAQIHHSSLGWF